MSTVDIFYTVGGQILFFQDQNNTYIFQWEHAMCLFRELLNDFQAPGEASYRGLNWNFPYISLDWGVIESPESR